MNIPCGDKQLDLSTPKVMGVLNLDPQSYNKDTIVDSAQQALARAQAMVADGAGIIDVGAEATNAKVQQSASVQQQLDRLLPTLELLCDAIPVPISLDSSEPQVIREASKLGVNILNDVRALRRPGALEAAAATGLPVILMHMKYLQQVPTSLTTDADIMSTVCRFLQQRVDACVAAGINRDKLLVDPGIGAGCFGKTMDDNLTIIARLTELQLLQLPIVTCISRKLHLAHHFIEKSQRLASSLAAVAMAVNNGATIIRCHDVKATVDAVVMTWEILQSNCSPTPGYNLSDFLA